MPQGGGANLLDGLITPNPNKSQIMSFTLPTPSATTSGVRLKASSILLRECLSSSRIYDNIDVVYESLMSLLARFLGIRIPTYIVRRILTIARVAVLVIA